MARFSLRVASVLVVLCAAPGVVRAQTSSPPPRTSQSQTTGQENTTTSAQSTSAPAAGLLDARKAAAERAAQADLDRVKQGLQALPPVRFDVPTVRFYAKVYGDKKITFEDLVGSFNLLNGPVPYAGMTHQEFMNMSRPKDLFSTTGITPRDMLQAALVNVAAQATINAIKKSLQALREARTEREIEAIRAQIDRELAALNGQIIKKIDD